MCGGRVAVVCGVLALMVACPWVSAQERPPACPAPPPPPSLAGEGGRLPAADLWTLFAQADTAHNKGDALPDPLLRPAVEAALRPETPWTCAEVAIRFFDLYKDRPWATDVIAPFAMHHAPQLLLNADAFAALHRDWSKRALVVAAAHAPPWVFRALTPLTAVDIAWAKQLIATAAARHPVLALTHTAGLLSIDRPWAHGVLHRAVQAAPQHAVSLLQTYGAEPWGPQLFAEAARAVPGWTITIAAAQRPESPLVLAFLQRSPDPHLRLLAQLAQRDDPGDVAARAGVFLEDIVAHHLSLEEAIRLSTQEQTYFRALVARTLATRAPHPRVREEALQAQATAMFQALNALFDHPERQRFRILEPLTARELYILMA